jgi:hypothetical protein
MGPSTLACQGTIFQRIMERPATSADPSEVQPQSAGDVGEPCPSDHDGSNGDAELASAVQHDWWRLGIKSSGRRDALVEDECVALGSKVVVLLHLLALTINEGDKMVLFSQSLSTLDFIEMILTQTNWGKLVDVKSTRSDARLFRWTRGNQYLRIDGAVSDRQPLIDDFNRRDACKLFMISTKAGNMGINLQSANRVVVFDSSWNPANDLQAIFRCYRYGQKKNVFVYRFLAGGSMEEKIYKKQVDKQARSARIVDAQMPENHFTFAEKNELMTFVEDDEDHDTFMAAANSLMDSGIQVSSCVACADCVQDRPLRAVIEKRAHLLSAIECHQRLLADNEEEHLNEAEQREAELEYLRDTALSASGPAIPQSDLYSHLAQPTVPAPMSSLNS